MEVDPDPKKLADLIAQGGGYLVLRDATADEQVDLVVWWYEKDPDTGKPNRGFGKTTTHCHPGDSIERLVMGTDKRDNRWVYVKCYRPKKRMAELQKLTKKRLIEMLLEHEVVA